jgi:hypothetical protein
MNEKPQTTARASATPANEKPIAPHSTVEVNEALFGVLSGLNDHVCNWLHTCNAESLGFMNQQFQQTSKLPEVFSGCKNAQDITHACSRFAETVSRQNMAQTQRLMQIGNKFVNDLFGLMNSNSGKS